LATADKFGKCDALDLKINALRENYLSHAEMLEQNNFTGIIIHEQTTKDLKNE
jgi:hypothetical protein